MFVLDSDTYTHLLHQNPKVLTLIEQGVIERVVVGITIITKIEILQGRMSALIKADTHQRFLTAQERLISTEVQVQEMRIVLLDEGALTVFDKLLGVRDLKKIGRPDLLIAIALAHRATLVTRNTKHFKLIPQLKCETWVD